MYIDLIKTLSEQDKTRIENYIKIYEANSHFIGVDKWLQNWSHSKQKLYKLLGNNLMKEYNFNYVKNTEEIESDITRLNESPFINEDYRHFLTELKNKQSINYSIITDLTNFLYIRDTFKEGNLKKTIKFKLDGKKTFQLQKGAKLLKCYYRIIEYFKDWYNFDLKKFEDFKTQYSMITNDKNIMGKMVLSIHPLDFMTMSDNNSHWTSCMSWAEEGCYHLGTVEMMNSNNVIVAYLKIGEDNFYFKNKHEDDFKWNNKRWRVLTYITKDIIMSGKAYPYFNDEFCKFIIGKVKDLAKENLHWSYSFGPELYKDMMHISSNVAMENNRYWSRKDPKKHNIIWDTKAMYNDMLNSNVKYWCYRNKVNKNKIISVSGKAPCVCCGEEVADLSEDYYYNDRYKNVERVICTDCINKYFNCGVCGSSCSREGSSREVYSHSLGKNITICDDCYNNLLACPDCGKPFTLFSPERCPHDDIFILDNKYKDNPPEKVKTRSIYESEAWNPWEGQDRRDGFVKMGRLCVCNECRKKFAPLVTKLKTSKKDYQNFTAYTLVPTEYDVIYSSDLKRYTFRSNINLYNTKEDIKEIF